MHDPIKVLIRESQHACDAAEVVIRLANGERWSFNADSELFTPDGYRVPFGDLHRILVRRSVPYLTYRGHWVRPANDGEGWKAKPDEGPREGRCDVDFLTDQIVRVSRLYPD